MKKNMILALSLFLSGGAYASGSPDVGEPLLPADALAVRLDPHGPLPSLKSGLDRIAGIRWSDPVVPAEEDAIAIASATSAPGYSASLFTEVETRALPGGPPPRDCGDVIRERSRVRAWIDRTDQLRRQLDQRLTRLDRACHANPACDTSALDAPLAELGGLLGQLNAYAERETAAAADRLLVYRFRLDEAPGLALVRAGWHPVGEGVVTRVHYYRSPWDIGPDFGFGAEGKLSGPPESQPDGGWLVQRALTATHGCVNGQVFRLEFRATFAPGGSQAPTRQELIRAISL